MSTRRSRKKTSVTAPELHASASPPVSGLGAPVAAVLWAIAAVLFATALTLALRVEWSFLPDTTPPRIEDRRANRFRNFTYSQTERMLRHLMRQARAASTPQDRAVYLARVAALQQERGFRDSALAAGEEALQLTANDAQLQAEIRSILTRPLRLDDVLPSRSRQPDPQ